MRSKILIGWREWVALPELGAERIKAKIDTGAKTSAIHAFKIKKIKVDGEDWAEFRLHPIQKRKRPELLCRAPIVDERIIKSSNGQTETRFVVSTQMTLGPCTTTIELTLTSRDEMGFRMLIGREALRNHFYVDSGMSFGLGTPAMPTFNTKD